SHLLHYRGLYRVGDEDSPYAVGRRGGPVPVGDARATGPLTLSPLRFDMRGDTDPNVVRLHAADGCHDCGLHIPSGRVRSESVLHSHKQGRAARSGPLIQRILQIADCLGPFAGEPVPLPYGEYVYVAASEHFDAREGLVA